MVVEQIGKFTFTCISGYVVIPHRFLSKALHHIFTIHQGVDAVSGSPSMVFFIVTTRLGYTGIINHKGDVKIVIQPCNS